MRFRRSYALALAVTASAAACKSATNPAAPGAPDATAFAFRVSPIAIDQLRFIVPLGNLNPPAHTVPTDHIYFYFADPAAGEQPVARRTDFFAPGDGTVTTVIDNNIGADRKIMFSGTNRIQYYVDHLIPTVSLARGTVVHAGDRLGTTGGAYGIDLGLTNQDFTLTGLLNLSRYPQDEVHTDAPLKYFEEPLRTTLYGKVMTASANRDGKFDDDEAGRLSGNWFAQTDQTPLAFAYDTYDPSQVRISLMDATFGAGVFAIAPGEPDPRDVSVASGRVSYTLILGTTTRGRLFAQMTDDSHLTVEVFANATGAVGFTPAARAFAR